MKKYLFIFFSVLSLNSFSDETYNEAVIDNMQDIGSNVSDIESNLQHIYDGLTYYLFSDEYKDLINTLNSLMQGVLDRDLWLTDFYDDLSYTSLILEEFFYTYLNNTPEYFNFLSTNLTDIYNQQNQFYDYLYQYSLGSNVESSKIALESIDSHIDNLKISVSQLGDKIDQIVVNGNNTSDDLQTIIGELKKLNGDSSGSSSQLPTESISFYDLTEYGKDVNIKNLSNKSFETTGEYNKDVHKMLINLNQLGSSQNNALLSMLTNVQVIAASVSGTAEGEDKVEKDIEERGYKAEQANQELNSIVSQSFESYFAPPRVSEVFNGVTVSLSDTQLPSRITIIDTFHYESETFSAELSDIGFDVPNGLLDLAHYGRIVFGFLYWTAAVYIALFVFRLWIKLYTYVSGLLN